ncbi:adenylosuccinate lyase [uncultured Croceitalea sp.]|uniref:adenylosuccinate lyase n=1 Tax=uncultured Croceitalea sp. TaxID=1798908 RepID=UPI003306517F
MPELVEPLLKEVFRQDKINDFNASWVFDHLMRKRLVFLLPHLELFTKGLSTIASESCMRPMAHTCELLTEAYYKERLPIFAENITEKHLERIVNTCFDWLIGEHKVATKVFAMTSLFYLGLQFKWIHPELQLVLEDSIPKGTVGYKNRAKKTLQAIKANKR